MITPSGPFVGSKTRYPHEAWESTDETKAWSSFNLKQPRSEISGDKNG